MKPFTIELEPRLYETDAMGHINNASIAAWMEVVRVRFLETLVEGGSAAGRDWILASIHIDYVGETFYGEPVLASVVDAKVGRTSLTCTCEMSQGGRTTVKGVAVLVHWDPDTKQTTPVGDALRARVDAL